MQTADKLLRFHRALFARTHRYPIAIKASYFLSICIKHLGIERERTLTAVIVLYFRLSVYHSLMARDVEIRGIYIRTRSTQIGIQRQSLMKQVGDVQIHILRNTAIVSVEVTVVPLIAAVMYTRAILPVIVAAHGNHVIALSYEGSEVETTSHHAVFAEAEVMPVEIEVGPLAHSFKLYIYLFITYIA